MSSQADVLVEIPQGKLRGLKEETFGNVFYSFQKIPYAKPPVGNLRFKDPEPAEGWKGVRDATAMGPTAPAFDVLTRNYSEAGDEDCLFANVYTRELPGKSSKKYPVMVWIHGGAFSAGTGNRDVYGPEVLMQHDIILVTFNYRLGALGFMSLESKACTGNFGLKDQRLLLRWVQQNISHFGGDKDNVTIFGESAGGASVHYQVLSPSTKGLFKKAIAESGSALCQWAYSKTSRECAFLLGKRLGCETTDEKVLMEFLMKASAKDIVNNSEHLIKEIQGELPWEYLVVITFAPTAEPESEGAFITEEPLAIIEKGLYQDVPYVTGVCTKEVIGLAVKNTEDFVDWTTDEQFQQFIPRDITLEKGSKKALTIARKIREFYYKNGPSLDGYIDLLTDYYFIHGTRAAAKKQGTRTGHKSPTYLYRFTYEGQRNLLKVLFQFNHPGTAHADELGYLFTTNMAPLPPLELGTPDYDFSLKFSKMWVDFATTGKLDSKWLPVSKDSFPCLDIGAEIKPCKNFYQDRAGLWEEIYGIANE